MKKISAFLVVIAMVALGACQSSEPNDSQQRQAREDQQAGSESVEEVTIPPQQQAEPPSQPVAQANEVVQPPAGPANPALLNPSLATETAPAQYTVRFDTTKGEVLIDVTRSWAPIGADRFYNLVRIGYFDNIAFFRVIPGFMAQVGLNGDPAVNRAWRDATIQDDTPTQSNTQGMVSFATSGVDSRVQQFFVNFGNNARLDPMGFAPFGRVRNMAVVNQIHGGYGEGAPGGRGPSQSLIQSRGNEYLRSQFPNLDYIRSASIVTP
ncbi:MAG: peptidyl-prolyl cis-trans isomerase A (cyclophilin A) [Polyangiales bacterium]|jgi:peptidyl-prolyl cis-trans isomerase A (cyclophilin A)